MRGPIEKGFMVFLGEGREGIGAVRDVTAAGLVVYVENAGEFEVPTKAVKAVHDSKVILDASQLHADVLRAIGHVHDSEDPNLVG